MRYIIANWKMVLTPEESEVLAEQICDGVMAKGGVPEGMRLVLCPTFTALEDVGRAINATENHQNNSNPILLGAQDVAQKESGAMTGEVSARELEEIGCAFCIIGHSERREQFGETNAQVNEKAKLLLAHGITPVICVGETKEERVAMRTKEVVIAQVRECTKDLLAEKTLIAYEPRWVIGTGHPVTVAEAEEVMQEIAVIAPQTPLLYGGAVDAENAQAFLLSSSIQGLLIGTASRDPQQITAIVTG